MCDDAMIDKREYMSKCKSARAAIWIEEKWFSHNNYMHGVIHDLATHVSTSRSKKYDVCEKMT